LRRDAGQESRVGEASAAPGRVRAPGIPAGNADRQSVFLKRGAWILDQLEVNHTFSTPKELKSFNFADLLHRRLVACGL